MKSNELNCSSVDRIECNLHFIFETKKKEANSTFNDKTMDSIVKPLIEHRDTNLVRKTRCDRCKAQLTSAAKNGEICTTTHDVEKSRLYLVQCAND